MLSRQWPQPTEALPIRHELDTVPFYPQEAYQCGPASLAMTLTWSGIQVDPEAITPEVFTPSLKGSLQSAMISTARRRGRVAYPISGVEEMLEEVAAGHPVIILQNLGLAWYPVWHYAVVVGYDLEQGIVLLHSGVTSQKRLSQRVFNNTWARGDYWGLLVLPPSRLPATATEHNYVSAVLGLEKAQQWLAAIEGYNTALARWSSSLSARMGLGNSYYALGDLESAEAAFREATRQFPTNGMAFNNLAQVLWEQGKQQEALEAASRAVNLGGPLVEEYRRTLKEIQKGKP
ncbi:MAG: PA2778 family cysteine peptidase [Deltaproteobacteria bacterium]|nr:PA2778 family cysteine peptidase [Deltaproteobacteria bacterium]